MKEITINNRDYYYKIINYGDYDYDITLTKFYTKSIVKKKKYCFFGELVDKEVFNKCFTVRYSVEDTLLENSPMSTYDKNTIKIVEQNYFNLINNIKQNI